MVRLGGLGWMAVLFHTLLAQLLVHPLLVDPLSQRNPWMLSSIHIVIVLAIVVVVGRTHWQKGLAYLLGIPLIVLCWFHEDSTRLGGAALSVVLYCYAIWLMIPYAMRHCRIGPEQVFTASAAYLLIGLGWSHCYETLDWFQPGSLVFRGINGEAATMSWYQYQYFSFTTLTTLGYGDIRPATSLAQSLSILEAITGILFVSLAVARVIGVYVYQMLTNSRTQSDCHSADRMKDREQTGS